MKNIFAAIVFSISLFVAPLFLVHAAEIDFVPLPSVGIVGEEVAVDLYLDTEGEALNALSGEVAITTQSTPPESPTGRVTLSRIHDGDSIIGAWLVKANIREEGRVTFSGIIPRGITTEKGKLMTLYFVPKQSGVILLSASGSMFEDKALGQRLSLRLNSVALPIREHSGETGVSTLPPKLPEDVAPPFGIRAIIAQNDEMFDGKPFIIVDAKDSQSGIAIYELLEASQTYATTTLSYDTGLPWWRIENLTSSVFAAPLLYPLGTTFIYVRVIDREGNATVFSVNPPTQLLTEKTGNVFNTWPTYAILIVVTGFFLWPWYRKRKWHA